MKTRQQQIVLLAGSAILLGILYLFGRTIPTSSTPANQPEKAPATAQFDVNQYITEARQQLPPFRQSYLSSLEAQINQPGSDSTQVYQKLSAFWRDSAKKFVPYVYYLTGLSKLEKTEKSLTFAARQIFEEMRGHETSPLKTWLAQQAKELFEKSLELNPTNDSNTVALGACYIFGNLSDNPMQGILKIRSVAEKNPGNLYAQLMLGIGGVVSGQYSKAIERLARVVKEEPQNAEAVYYLAEAYDLSGDKANAVKWFTQLKELVKGSDFEKALNERLKNLQ